MADMKRPGVGMGIIILNDNGEVLLGKRINSHGGGTWSLPGGHLEMGESVFHGAAREVKEETDLDVEITDVVSVTNDVAYEKHYVTLGALGKVKGGSLKVNEPEKCTEWGWFAFENLPQPLFVPSMNFIKNFREKKFFEEYIDVDN